MIWGQVPQARMIGKMGFIGKIVISIALKTNDFQK
jgi:hypothetical protein